MQIVKTTTVVDHLHLFNRVTLQHPQSLVEHTSLPDERIAVALSAHPAGKEDEATIILSVFLDGEQHVVFSGTPDDAYKFFQKFPKN